MIATRAKELWIGLGRIVHGNHGAKRPTAFGAKQLGCEERWAVGKTCDGPSFTRGVPPSAAPGCPNAGGTASAWPISRCEPATARPPLLPPVPRWQRQVAVPTTPLP